MNCFINLGLHGNNILNESYKFRFIETNLLISSNKTKPQRHRRQGFIIRQQHQPTCSQAPQKTPFIFPLHTIPSKPKIQSDDNYSDTDDGTYFQNYSGDVLIVGMSPLLFFVYGDLLEWLCLRFFFGNKLCTAAFFKMMNNAYFYRILV